MEIITKKVKDLKPYERNPRRNDEAVERSQRLICRQLHKQEHAE